MGCLPSRPKSLPKILNANDALAAAVGSCIPHEEAFPPNECSCGHGVVPVELSIDTHRRSPWKLKSSQSTTASCTLSQSSTLRDFPPSDRAPTPPPKDIVLHDKRIDDLAAQQNNITHLINNLTAQLHEYIFTSSHNRSQTLADLDDIISSLPSSPTKLTLIHLRTSTAQAYSTPTNLKPSTPVLPSLWQDFLAHPPARQRAIATQLRPSSQPMLMFDLLRHLQHCCERESVCDRQAQEGIQGVFDAVLRELTCAEGNEWGTGLGGHVGMKWRVLGLVARGRVEKLCLSLEGIAGARMQVSGVLLAFLEGLAEA